MGNIDEIKLKYFDKIISYINNNHFKILNRCEAIIKDKIETVISNKNSAINLFPDDDKTGDMFNNYISNLYSISSSILLSKKFYNELINNYKCEIAETKKASAA